MVKIIEQTTESVKDGITYVRAELFADTKSDDLHVISGLGENTQLVSGSSVMTAKGDFAFLNSNGVWNWM